MTCKYLLCLNSSAYLLVLWVRRQRVGARVGERGGIRGLAVKDDFRLLKIPSSIWDVLLAGCSEPWVRIAAYLRR
jgi:hypothetical protein